MTDHRDPGFDPRIAAWLEDDPAASPPEVLATVLAAIPSVPQRRAALRVPWRNAEMTASLRLIGGLAAALVIVVGGLVLLNSRNPTVGPPASPSPSPTPVESSGPIGGTYTAVFTGTDPAEIPAGGQPLPAGLWQLVLPNQTATAPNNVAKVTNPQAVGTPVQLAVTFAAGNLITFAPDPTCRNQTGTPTSGTYRYQVSGNNLTLMLVGADSCADRVASFTAHSWLKIQ